MYVCLVRTFHLRFNTFTILADTLRFRWSESQSIDETEMRELQLGWRCIFIPTFYKKVKRDIVIASVRPSVRPSVRYAKPNGV